MSNQDKCPINKFGPSNTHKNELCAMCSFSNRVDLNVVCDCPEGMTIKDMGDLIVRYLKESEDYSKSIFQEYVKKNFKKD